MKLEPNCAVYISHGFQDIRAPQALPRSTKRTKTTHPMTALGILRRSAWLQPRSGTKSNQIKELTPNRTPSFPSPDTVRPGTARPPLCIHPHPASPGSTLDAKAKPPHRRNKSNVQNSRVQGFKDDSSAAAACPRWPFSRKLASAGRAVVDLSTCVLTGRSRRG